MRCPVSGTRIFSVLRETSLQVFIRGSLRPRLSSNAQSDDSVMSLVGPLYGLRLSERGSGSAFGDVAGGWASEIKANLHAAATRHFATLAGGVHCILHGDCMDCPHCSTPLSERGSFCKACGGQTRCLSCKAVLEPGATACVECGTKIGEAGAQREPGASALSTPVAGRNTLTFHEDKDGRSFEASLTDDAMHSLGGVFGDLFAQRGTVRPPAQMAVTPSKQGPTVEGGQLAIPPAVPETPGVPDTPPPPPAPAASGSHPASADIATFFAANGDKLELIDNRLKAASHAEYTRQLTYLFLYAHEAYGRMSVPEHDLNTLLTAAKVMDASGNTRTFLRKRIGIVADGDSSVKLNAGGRDAAKKALRDALDANLPVNWSPDSIAVKPKGGKGKGVKGKAKV
jgi:hypothetical protein